MGSGRPEIESCDGDMIILGRCMVAGLFGNAAVFEGLKVNPLASQADPGVAVYRLLRLPGEFCSVGSGQQAVMGAGIQRDTVVAVEC